MTRRSQYCYHADHLKVECRTLHLQHLHDWTGALKLQDWTQTDEVARVDNAELDTVGPVWQGWTMQNWTL